MKPQQPSGLDIQTRLIGRAAADVNFRQQLLANGRATIEKELGIELPPGLEIQVIQETPTRLCLVLPMWQEAQGHLANADLQNVAGGVVPNPLPKPVSTVTESALPSVYSLDRLSMYIQK